jgi:hypothetical protein
MTQPVNDAMFFKAINQWESTAPMKILLNIGEMKKHFLEEHGLVFESIIGLRGARVVDEKKYVMFLLKYS